MNHEINPRAAPRDERLIHRLSGMNTAGDLPADLRDVTDNRLEIIRRSRLRHYWSFMTGVTDSAMMPAPRSIMDPGDTRWLKAGTETDRKKQEQVLLELYGMSVQEQIQFRDSMEYTILNGGRQGPTEEHLRAYARRVCLQINGILNHGGMDLEAEIHQLTPGENITACRFTTVELDQAITRERQRSPGRKPVREATIRMETVSSRAELLEMLPPETREAAGAIGDKREALRIYDQQTFWTIAVRIEKRWSEAQALRDADEVIADHMEDQTPPGPHPGRRRPA